MIKIWGRKTSSNVQKVMWLVGELGLTHKRIDIGGKFGGLDTDEFYAMNPHRRIPVLQDRDLTLWESHAIVRYLAAAYGAGVFWPGAPKERALLDRWIDWTASDFNTVFMQLFWGYYRTPPDQRKQKQIDGLIKFVSDCVARLDEALADTPYLGGDALTLADIPPGVLLYRYFTLDLDLPKPANFSAWYERLAARPAFQTHVMVDYEELKGRLAF